MVYRACVRSPGSVLAPHRTTATFSPGRGRYAPQVTPANAVAAACSTASLRSSHRACRAATIASSGTSTERTPPFRAHSSAALDPEDFPVLSGRMNLVLPALVDHRVYCDGLRQLIGAAAAGIGTGRG